MASHDERITKLESKMEAVLSRFDGLASEKIEAEKQNAIIDALAKKDAEIKDKEVVKKEFWIKLLWIPIILLIVSSILSWLQKCSVVDLVK